MSRKGLLLLVLLVGLIAVAGCTQKPAEKQATTPAPTAAPTPAPTAAPTALADDGKALYASKGCGGCHGANGEGADSPALKGLAGAQVTLVDGAKVTADDAFILESIVKPGATVVKGYSAMPNLGVSDADAKALLAYIKTLK